MLETTPIFMFVSVLLITAILAYFVSGQVHRLYTRMGWVDDPNKNKHPKVIHTKPVPRGGGLVIFFAISLAVTVFLGIDKHILGILLGAGVLTIVGAVDDVKDLNPYWRIVSGLIAAMLVVAAGIGIAYVTNPLNNQIIRLNEPQLAFTFAGKMHTIWILADVGALIWISWCMNMVNWSKGLDGQLPGVVVIAATVIGILSLRFVDDITQWPVFILAAITAGAYLGFLPFNMYPQKMMPGYGGGSLAGFFLAVLSILSGAKLATLILVLGIPMIDAVYVIIRRLSKKQSPVWGDRSHFHHLLLDLGVPKKNIAWFYWIMSASLGILALQLNAQQKAFTILLIGLLFGAVLVWLNYFIMSSKPPDHDSGLKT